ncbi:MAG TPA: hypothetical protein VGM69_16245 [Chloroflexota bacterium]|jgi:hypothetical protein
MGELVADRNRPRDVDVALVGKSGDFLLVVSVKNAEKEGWAERVLRAHGALEAKVTPWLVDPRNTIVHGRSPGTPPVSNELADHTVILLHLALERGVLDPSDVLALLVTAPSSADPVQGDAPEAVPSASERRRRVRDADAELREVSRRLEEGLRTEHPDLFDRRGHLRADVLAQRVAVRTGGKMTLSRDDVHALEEAHRAAAPRSADAP